MLLLRRLDLAIDRVWAGPPVVGQYCRVHYFGNQCCGNVLERACGEFHRYSYGACAFLCGFSDAAPSGAKGCPARTNEADSCGQQNWQANMTQSSPASSASRASRGLSGVLLL